MSLNRGEVNPLGVLELRKLSFIPEHFSVISIENYYYIDIKKLEYWITFNLNGRYALKKRYTIDQKNKMREILEIGLEDPKEITLLTLGCPYLHNKKELW